MKTLSRLILISGLLTVGFRAPAQEASEVDQLRKQVQEMKAALEAEQKQREQIEAAQKQQREQLEALQKQLTAMQHAQPAASPETSAPPATVTAEQVQRLNEQVEQVVEAQKQVLPNKFNPAIGLVGETIFSYQSKPSLLTGSARPGGYDVDVRSMELNISAAVDPFAKGYAVINASADAATGEATLGVEEAAIQTTSLPWNLEVKAGRFFGEFGRLAYIHDHELPFVNRPLVLNQDIGGESRTDGLQVNWLVPTEHYISLTAGVGDSFGGDSPNPNNPGDFRPLNGLNFWGRLSTYFDLSPNWQLESGVSGLINPHTEDRGGAIALPGGVSTATEHERRLAGVDLKLSYVPLQNNQFTSFTWGSEVLYSNNRYLFDPNGIASSGDEFEDNVGSLGLYSYVNYKWSRQWSAGFLFDWVQNPYDKQAETYAYSPFITFALSHWNQLRLQYTHSDHNAASGLQNNDAIYLQWTWIIGSHSHGWQQR